MARRSKAERLKEAARRAEELAARKQQENARKFSRSIDATSDSLNDLQKNIKSTLREVRNTSDDKAKAKALAKLNEEMSQLEAQAKTLQSGFSRFGNTLSNTENEIASMTVNASRDMLKSLRSVVEEENKKAEEEAKSAEEALREARRNSIKQSNIFIMGQEEALRGVRDSLSKQQAIRSDMESLALKVSQANSDRERKLHAKVLQKRKEELVKWQGIANGYFSKLDDSSEEFKNLSTEIEGANEAVNALGDSVESLTQGLLESSDELREGLENLKEDMYKVVSTLQLDSILQSMSTQIDGFTETRRQILSRVGKDFDREGFSDAVSDAMSDVDLTYSRNEMANAYKDFINTTRIQNMEMSKKYISDMASIQKAYGTSMDSVKNIMWQDINSKQDGQMLRAVSNVAAELENNSNLYASSDAILQSMNEKAELIYGVALGDSKRQKTMLKSVAAIQAIQETAANMGVTDFNEAVSKIASQGTVYDAMSDETTQQMAQMLGISIEETYRLSQESPTDLNILAYQKLHGASEAEYYQMSQRYSELFGGSASMKAFGAQDEKDFRDIMEQVSISSAKGDQTETSLATEKSNELLSVTDKLENWGSDLAPIKAISDMLGELDLDLANTAHAMTIAYDAVMLALNWKEFMPMLAGLGPGIAAAGTAITGAITSVGATMSAGLATAGTALSGALASVGATLSAGISTIGPMVGSFLLNPITLAVAGAAITIKDAFDGFAKSEEWLGEKGKTGTGKAASALGGAIGGTGPGIGQGDFMDVAGNVVSNTLKDAALGAALGGPLGAAIGAGVGAITGLIGGERIANALVDVFDTTVEGIDSAVENISDFSQYLGPAGKAFSNIIEGQWDLLKETGSEIIDIWDDPNRGILSKVAGTFVTLAEVPFKEIENIVVGIKDGFTEFFTDLYDGFTGFFTKVFDFFDFFGGEEGSSSSILGSFAGGLSEVPNDGVAYLHEGEAVLTKEQAVNARADGGIEVGNAWNPQYSDLYLAEEVRKILDSSGGAFGHSYFTSMDMASNALLGAGMSESDVELFMRNINAITRDMESLEYNSSKMNEGFKGYFRSENETREKEEKFQKALKRFFGLDASDGMAGTSGSGGSIFSRLLRSITGGGTPSSGGVQGSSSRGSVPRSGTAAGTVRDMGNMGDMSDGEKKIWEVALKTSAKTGIKPEFLYAQLALESSRGGSALAQSHNNFGGIKYVGEKGTSQGELSPEGDYYAKYDSLDAYAEDYARVLSLDRYAGARTAQTAEEYVKAMHEGGYFTGNYNDYLRNLSSIAKEAPTGYVIDRYSGTAAGDMDGFQSKFFTKWESAPGLTDLANVQEPVKMMMNQIGEEYFNATGEKLVLTGGAEKGIHAGGEFGHEGGWKIDIDSSANGAVLTDLVKKYGVSMGNESDHYDLAFHGTNIGGSALNLSEEMDYSMLRPVEQPIAELSETSKELTNNLNEVNESLSATQLSTQASGINFGGIKDEIANTTEWLGNSVDNEIEWLGNSINNEIEYLSSISYKDVWSGLAETYGYVSQSIKNNFSSFMSSVENEIEYIKSLPDSISGWFDNNLTYVNNQLTAAGEFIQNLPSVLQQWMEESTTSVVQGMTDIYNSATTWASDTINSVTQYFSELPGTVSGYLSEIGAMISSIPSGVSAWLGEMGDLWSAGEAAGVERANMEGHAGGLSFVPYPEYITKLHYGEAVLTKDQADLLRNQVDSDGGIAVPNYETLNAASLEGDLATVISEVSSNQDNQEVVNAIVMAVGTLSSKLDAVVSAIGAVNLQVNSPMSSGEPKDVINSNTGFIYSL